MAFFQNSVLNKYLKAQDKTALKAAYARFTAYFHHPDIQQNILAAKEEQFQEGFLRELFVNVLGYVLNPNPSYNLTTELKNEKGAKKADGAVLQDGMALAVIELKGTDTTDLDKINAQAFNYKNNHSNCVYVVTSNFERLRFFIHNAVEHIEFNLFSLTEEEFRVLWLCLSSESLLAGIPLRAKEESLLAEEAVTKMLYRDYSAFKNELWSSMVKHNPEFEKLLLYKKAQKLLDRILFILFSEDKGLLPPNSITSIVQQWEKLKELDEYRPLYERFQKYFGYLNTGWKGKNYEIFAYNGGLFLPDEVLDAVRIDDDVLHKHVTKLTGYDFGSEVDVNILGHIFEHSLNEIETITAELEGVEVDRNKSKRKKDGVFYTPKYITKYIVESTIGNLCEAKKAEFGIKEGEYAKGRKNRKKDTVKLLADKLESYRGWLLKITICDPACGSGAFLNQALEYLIAEHRYVDELQAQLVGASIVFPDVANHILERNIFGTDINEESVEIAKLSLWLRTAQRGRKLTSLNNNIKIGNSLVSDPDVAGEKAFCWEHEFPEVFARGGFDVIIGNPPYLRVQGLRGNFEKETVYYERSYASATGRFDIYVLFLEKAFQLINPSGMVSFILPHKFMVSDFGEGIRRFLLKNSAVSSLVHFGSEMVFEEASTYTCIIGLSHGNDSVKYRELKPAAIQFDFQFHDISYESLSNGKWNFHGEDTGLVFQRMNSMPRKASDVFSAIRVGVDTGADDLFLLTGKVVSDRFIGFSERVGGEVVLESSIVRPVLRGENVKKYSSLDTAYYVVYPHYEKDGKTYPYDEEELASMFPLTYSYFLPYKEELVRKKIHKKTNPKFWFSLHRSREISLFEKEKIVTPETSLGGNMTIDNAGYCHNTQVYSLVKRDDVALDNKFLLALLNSSLLWFYLQNTGAVLRGGYFRFKTKYLEPFPLPEDIPNEEQQPFIERVESVIHHTALLQDVQSQLSGLLVNKFCIDKLSVKLQKWYQLDFKQFLGELKKAKVVLSLPEEAEWMSYFSDQKRKAEHYMSIIQDLNRQLDSLTYTLYGLTEEEAKMVENF